LGEHIFLENEMDHLKLFDERSIIAAECFNRRRRKKSSNDSIRALISIIC